MDSLENSLARLSAYEILSRVQNDEFGLGAIPKGSRVHFTGHSLGGHLAMLLAEMANHLDRSASIGDLATYNAPGFHEHGSAEKILTDMLTRLVVGDTKRYREFLAGKHIGFYAYYGTEVTAGLGKVPGERVPTFIEGAVTSLGFNPLGMNIDNHAITRLGDSLAVMSLLAQMDKSLAKLSPNQLAKLLNPLFESAAPNEGASLDNVLSALDKLFP